MGARLLALVLLVLAAQLHAPVAAGAARGHGPGATGTVVGWGANASGAAATPAGTGRVRAVAAGTVAGFGWNGYGPGTSPAGLADVTAIAAGSSFSLALTRAGRVVGWGLNHSGQAAPPSDLDSSTWVPARRRPSMRGTRSPGRRSRRAPSAVRRCGGSHAVGPPRGDRRPTGADPGRLSGPSVSDTQARATRARSSGVVAPAAESVVAAGRATGTRAGGGFEASRAPVGAVAVVAADADVWRRAARALAGEGIELRDSAAAVDELAESAADTTLVLTTLAGVGEQRRMVRAAALRFPDAAKILIAPPSLTAVRRALDAGVCGYVAEAELELTLVPTIRAAAAGQVAVPHELRRHIVRPALSHREKQTLTLLVSGLTNRQIADRLFLAESTVKTHVTAVFNKLGVGSRSEAAALVLDPAAKLAGGLLAPPTSNGAEPVGGSQTG